MVKEFQFCLQNGDELLADIRRADKLITRLDSIRVELRDRLRGRRPGEANTVLEDSLFEVLSRVDAQILTLNNTRIAIRLELDKRARRAGNL